MESFCAESGADDQLEDVDVLIKENGTLVTEGQEPILDLKCTGKEVKIKIIRTWIKVPKTMKDNPDNCDLLYSDDKTRKVIGDDKVLKDYSEQLAGENSKLEVVYPRVIGSPAKPGKDLDAFSVKPKQNC